MPQGGSNVQKTDAANPTNQASRRPVRSSAGRRSLPEGYVATEDAYKKLEKAEDISTDEEADEENVLKTLVTKKRSANHRGRPQESIKRGRVTKRRSPPPPPLSPELQKLDIIDRSRSNSPDSNSQEPNNELSLTFNVPAGHVGPFVVKLNLGDLLGNPTAGVAARLRNNMTVNAHKSHTSSKSRAVVRNVGGRANGGYAGFLDLPPELRTMVYSLVFVREECIGITLGRNLCNSAAFLRTCSQVYEEGRRFLYADNYFKFSRQSRPRDSYFNPEWLEVGYKDIRRFLVSIGSNISLIRNVYFLFEDGAKSANPGKHLDDLRFVHDDQLVECLRLLANHGMLKKFFVTFNSRRGLTRTDERFIRHLRRVRADKFKELTYQGWNKSNDPVWGYLHDSKASRDVVKYLAEKIERRESMY